MSEVKQTIPGVELTSPCSCLVYWALRGLTKIITPQNLLIWTEYLNNCRLVLLYPNILGLIVGLHNNTLLLHFNPQGWFVDKLGVLWVDLRMNKSQLGIVHIRGGWKWYKHSNIFYVKMVGGDKQLEDFVLTSHTHHFKLKTQHKLCNNYVIVYMRIEWLPHLSWNGALSLKLFWIIMS